jgi:hypothetical protein
LVDATVNSEDNVQRIGAELSDLDDLSKPARVEATKAAARLNVLKHNHDSQASRTRREK